MEKKYRFALKLIFFLMIFLLSGNAVFGAKKKKTAAAETADTGTDVSVGSDAIKISASKKNRTFFSSINEQIILEVESGSPESITKAMNDIWKSESEYTDQEKVLIAVSADIMKIVWPSAKIGWEVFQYPEDNAYIGALKSAASGVFDSSTGNVDFLSTILPAFVVLETTSPTAELLDLSLNAVLNSLKFNENSVLGNYTAAQIYYKKGDFAAAENYISKVSGTTEAQEFYLLYAEILQKNQKLEEASSILSKVAGQNGNDIKILRQNACLSFEKGDLDSAEQYVARVLAQTPNDLEFVLFRAKILIAKNDYIHAVSLLDMYARQDTSSVDYLVLRATVQLDWSKNTAAASETIEKALNDYPENQDALMIAARISAATDSPVAGKYADELAEKVLSVNPDNIEARIYALEGLIQRKNWAEAYKISSEIIKNNRTPEIIYHHVETCLATGRKSEALETASSAYKQNSSDETICQAYVIAYCSAGSHSEAVALINSLMNGATAKMKSFLYYRKSFLEYSDDNVLADLRSSLISNPRNSDALFRLYEIYYNKQDYRKAQYYLRQVVAINPNDSSVKKLNEALTKLIK